MNEKEKYFEIYSGETGENYKNRHDEGYGRKFWGKNAIPFIKEQNPKSLLDVGCGFGRFCDAMSNYVENIYCLDIASVATGNVIDNPKINYIDSEAKKIPLPDKSIEWITSFDCLEHCLPEDIDDIFKEFDRVSTKGWVCSISYVSDSHNHLTLHMTVESESWWIDKMKKYGIVEIGEYVDKDVVENKYLILKKNMISEQEIQLIENELGDVSSQKFRNIVNTIRDGILIDIGVYEGASSRIMIENCLNHNNKIYAIDPIPNFTSNNPNYNYLKADSVEIGKNWDKGEVDLVFFDSVHAKEQVLCELFYWWDKIKEGGYAIFHDTSWEGYIHKKGHSCEGKKTGNTGLGYDSYGGINWETPDKAVESFFGINLNTDLRNIENNCILKIYEDDYIFVETNYALLGMTFIRKKKTIDYKNLIEDWDEIFKKRNLLLSYFL